MDDRFAFTVEGSPVPAPRMTTGQIRRLKSGKDLANSQIVRYLEWKDMVGWAAKAHGAQLMTGRLEVRMWFYLHTRRRRDWDNLAKAICDGLNSICYQDDSQVDRALITIRTGYQDEHVDVEIRRIAA